VFFEKENIDTLDSKGEVLLSILSSLAQDESRSISENSTWGIRRRFEQGKIQVNLLFSKLFALNFIIISQNKRRYRIKYSAA
jgi:DNA invertase Pin-like site-specific DNA recombinase